LVKGGTAVASKEWREDQIYSDLTALWPEKLVLQQLQKDQFIQKTISLSENRASKKSLAAATTFASWFLALEGFQIPGKAMECMHILRGHEAKSSFYFHHLDKNYVAVRLLLARASIIGAGCKEESSLAKTGDVELGLLLPLEQLKDQEIMEALKLAAEGKEGFLGNKTFQGL
jgi:hypothetical protein